MAFLDMRAALVTVLVGSAACGTIGDPGGGAANLVTSGSSGYGKISDPKLSTPIDEPYVLVDSAADLTDGSALFIDGVFRVFFTRTPRAGGSTEVWTADLPGLHALPVSDPGPVLVADQAWEGGAVRAAAVHEQGDGSLVMFYQGAQGIGRASSTDGGAHWTKAGLVVPGGTHPAITVIEGRWLLYFTKSTSPGIFIATSEDGMSFVPRVIPVLMPTGDPIFFDAAAVGQPSVIGGITAAGQLHVAMFYVGTSNAGVTAIGYAGSEDGMTFERAQNGRAILDPPSPNEMGPAAVFFPSQAVLFFNQQRAGVWAIAAATSP